MNGTHSSTLLLKFHRIINLEQFPTAAGSSQKSASAGIAAAKRKKSCPYKDNKSKENNHNILTDILGG